MGRYYTEAEMSHRYQAADRMLFARGTVAMTAESAAKFTWDLVELDRESGTYRRVQWDPGLETQIINAATARERMLAPMKPSLGNRLR